LTGARQSIAKYFVVFFVFFGRPVGIVAPRSHSAWWFCDK
jgi:hypothetical protein